jgi:hypothetical protein
MGLRLTGLRLTGLRLTAYRLRGLQADGLAHLNSPRSALEPISPGALEPISPGALEPISPGARKPWSPSALEPWSHQPSCWAHQKIEAGGVTAGLLVRFALFTGIPCPTIPRPTQRGGPQEGQAKLMKVEPGDCTDRATGRFWRLPRFYRQDSGAVNSGLRHSVPPGHCQTQRLS